MRLIVVCLMSLLTCSCVSYYTGAYEAKGKEFKLVAIPEGRAMLYIYREKEFVGHVSTQKLNINKKYDFRLRDNGYILFNLPPGDFKVYRHFKRRNGDILFEINAEAGKEYFYRYSSEDIKIYTDYIGTGVVTYSTGSVKYVEVDKEEALKGLSGTRLTENKINFSFRKLLGI